MKIEEITQLEKELTWIFAHVPWSNPDKRHAAALWTANFLKDLRAEANGSLQSREARAAQGLACSFCGKGLPWATIRKRRFCSERCKKRSQRKRPQADGQPGRSQTSKIASESAHKFIT